MQLVRYLFTVIIAAVLLAAAITWVTNSGLRRSGVDFYGKMNAASKAANQTNLILVGSSRVLKHLDPAIIDSATGLNSYNYGLNSGTIKTWYNIINYALIFQKNVKAVVLNIDYNMFDIARDPYKDAYYYPFEKDAAGILMNDSGTVRLVHNAKVFDISLYDDYAKYAAIDGWLRAGRIAQGAYKGYYPNRQLNNFEDIADAGRVKKDILVSEAGVKLLTDCIELCKKNNVKLILVMAPYFNRYFPGKYFENFGTIVNNVKEIARQNNIPFFDYTGMGLANDQQYFYNVNHLNSSGAAVYSRAVADSIKSYLKNGN